MKTIFPLAVLALVIVGEVIKDRYILHLLIVIFIYIILSQGMRMILLTGNINLAHAAFMGIGAYIYSILALKTGLNVWLCFLSGGLSAALLAAIVGSATLRLKGHYFAFVSFALCELIRQIWMKWKLAGGVGGMMNIPAPEFDLAGLTIDFGTKRPQYFFALFIMLLTVVVLNRLDKSSVGRSLRAIAQQPILAQCVGLNVTNYKVIIFSLSCFFAGLAGAFYAQYTSYISPYDFTFMASFYILVYVVVGGMGSVLGPIFGTVILIGIQETLSPYPASIPIILGVILIAVMLRSPMGLTGFPILKYSRVILRRWRREST